MELQLLDSESPRIVISLIWRRVNFGTQVKMSAGYKPGVIERCVVYKQKFGIYQHRYGVKSYETTKS